MSEACLILTITLAACMATSSMVYGATAKNHHHATPAALRLTPVLYLRHDTCNISENAAV